MNEFIKEELKKIKFELPEYDDSTTELFIPKSTSFSIKEGSCFLIHLENYILHPYDGFDLHKNWNKNIIPEDEYMLCEIKQVMGKMVKILGAGCNKEEVATGKMWEGWLPIKSFEIIKNI